MRVTHKMISNQTTADLQRGLEDIQTSIDKVSSGQTLRALSDDRAELKIASNSWGVNGFSSLTGAEKFASSTGTGC